MLSNPFRVRAAAAVVACALIAFAGSSVAEAKLSADEARAIAVEAYVYFYPLLSMDVTRRVTTNVPAGKSELYGPANMFHHAKSFPDAAMKVVVRPNFDTLYSSAWLELTREPMIVSAPDTADRYYLLPMLDMWTDVFAVPGKRTSGTAAASFAVVPPGWSGTLPPGVERIDAPTPHVWVIGRTQTNGPADYAAVHAVQAGYRVTPLSQWGKAPQPAPFTPDASVDMKTPPKEQVDSMPARAYFTDAAELLKQNPPHATDWSQLARLEKLGIVPGRSLDWDALDPVARQALEAAPAAALAWMKEKTSSLARVANGWQMNTDTMGVYGNYYLKRAIVAQVGLGANQPEDAIYPMNVGDAEGKPMLGEHDYVLHFAKSELPPATAFWSVTMYDADGYQAANAIDRFAIGDRDALKYNADGSLDLYIQNASPGKDEESNWLPAPKGPLGVTLRLYGPKPEAIDGRWNPPPIRRVR